MNVTEELVSFFDRSNRNSRYERISTSIVLMEQAFAAPLFGAGKRGLEFGTNHGD
jgi:hypothetical protein